jgi:hypothetical protein
LKGWVVAEWKQSENNRALRPCACNRGVRTFGGPRRRRTRAGVGTTLYIESFLFGLKHNDAFVLSLAVLLLAGATILSGYAAARRYRWMRRRARDCVRTPAIVAKTSWSPSGKFGTTRLN